MSNIPFLDDMTPEQKLQALESIHNSLEQSKEIHKKKITENVELVLQALKKIESDIRTRFDGVGSAIEKRVSTIKDGRDGINGVDGRDGKDGKPGRDGQVGPKGRDGLNGRDGIDGQDGVSVTNAHLDFDGSLVITLSNGTEIDVGEVMPMDLAEKIKIVSNGGGTSQYVVDTLASLQTQINNISTGGVTSVASADGSITVINTSGAIDLSVAVAASTTNVVVQVRNTTGATLTKGTVVYMSGATGQIPTVSKALATSDATSAQTLGMMSADLANNSNGYVTIIGLISNINTSAFTDGEQLYLSGTTAGTYTSTKPYAPIHLVYVAVVEHAHPTQGKIFVKVQNGYELDEIHNVSAQSPTTGQTIVYNSSTSLWEKNTVSLTAGVNGTLPIANGGTNLTSYATGDIIYASATNTLSKLTAGTNGYVLTLASGVPTWAASSGGGGSSSSAQAFAWFISR